jgi:hypothetical protein
VLRVLRPNGAKLESPGQAQRGPGEPATTTPVFVFFFKAGRAATTVCDVEARFWELVERAARHDEASRRLASSEGASLDEIEIEEKAAEAAMVEIVALVERDAEHRPVFVRCFEELTLWKRPSPFLLVAFCMRRLRLPEIPQLIGRDASAHSGTAYYAQRMNYWSAINHAYLDEVWECAACFDLHENELGGSSL